MQAQTESTTEKIRSSPRALSRQDYVIAPLRKSEMKKLRRWLNNKDIIEVAADEKNGQVYLLNDTKIIRGRARYEHTHAR
jgi:hypothetical protein